MQKKLLENLFENYSLYEIPLLKDNDALEINIGLSIQQIIDIVNLKVIR